MTYIFDTNNELQWLKDHRFIWDYYGIDIPDGKPYVFCRTANWSIALTRIKGELFFECYYMDSETYDYSSISIHDVLTYINSTHGDEELVFY
ncbi:TPA: hypothetical protein NNW70_004189 [Salmonella enterica]|nr:hypothetical protein [Salmonella enterica]HCH9607899.1 hypothetical protein [Salmonella enterica]HDI5000193.1 hypothetical protein [Salmonella enterica]